MLRFRVFVDGQVVAEDFLDSNDADGHEKARNIATKHMLIVAEAEKNGFKTMLESFDSEAPEDVACVRIGTDASLMVNPQVVHGEAK